jgi:hypothetical protein
MNAFDAGAQRKLEAAIRRTTSGVRRGPHCGDVGAIVLTSLVNVLSDELGDLPGASVYALQIVTHFSKLALKLAERDLIEDALRLYFGRRENSEAGK